MVIGESTQLAEGVHLYLWWRGAFLGVMSRITSLVVVWGHSSFAGQAPLSLWPWASLELWHRSPFEFRRGISLVAVVPPLGVLCGEVVISTCGIGGSSLVFRLLLCCSCEGLILIYFWGLVSICSRGAPL